VPPVRARLGAGIVCALVAGCIPAKLSAEDRTSFSLIDDAVAASCSNHDCCTRWYGVFDAETCSRTVREDLDAWQTSALNVGAKLVPEAARAYVAILGRTSSACVFDDALQHELDAARGRVFTGWKPPGERCESDDECADPEDGWAQCLFRPETGTCAHVGKCTAFRLGGVADDPCADGIGMSFGSPTCSEPKPDSSVRVCDGAPDLACSLVTRRCATLGGPGMPCVFDVDKIPCAPGARCVEVDGTYSCAAASAKGDACQLDPDCDGELVCRNHVCAEPLPDGATCPGDGCGKASICRGKCFPEHLAVTDGLCGAKH
jgi:hypothetical protein